jgi:hypothetical protein
MEFPCRVTKAWLQVHMCRREVTSMSADLRQGLPSKIHTREKFSWCRNSG